MVLCNLLIVIALGCVMSFIILYIPSVQLIKSFDCVHNELIGLYSDKCSKIEEGIITMHVDYCVCTFVSYLLGETVKKFFLYVFKHFFIWIFSYFPKVLCSLNMVELHFVNESIRFKTGFHGFLR